MPDDCRTPVEALTHAKDIRARGELDGDGVVRIEPSTEIIVLRHYAACGNSTKEGVVREVGNRMGIACL